MFTVSGTYQSPASRRERVVQVIWHAGKLEGDRELVGHLKALERRGWDVSATPTSASERLDLKDPRLALLAIAAELKPGTIEVTATHRASTASRYRRARSRDGSGRHARRSRRRVAARGCSRVNDPHVVSLRYRLVPIQRPNRSVEFINPPPIEHTAPTFRVRLENEVAVFDLVEHHAAVGSARRAIETFLRTWEIQHALSAGMAEFRFEYLDANVIDRNPPPPEPNGSPTVKRIGLASEVNLGGSLSLKVTRGRYPDPPANFAVSPDVETLWHRWEGYLAGREPLHAMAYFCLTVLEQAGGRNDAASTYNVSRRVLSTLGELATERGDARTARKARGASRPLTGNERAWLEEAVKRLLLRAGKVAATGAAPAAQLTLADLPPL